MVSHSAKGRSAAQRGHRGVELRDELREAAGQLDPIAAHIVERQRGTQPGMRVLGQCHPGKYPIDTETPGVVQEVDAVRRAMFRVETPSDVRLAHPRGDRVQIVVGEAKTHPHRRRLGEVQDLAGGGAPTGQTQYLPGHRQ